MRRVLASVLSMSATTIAVAAMAVPAHAAATPSTVYIMPADANVACNSASNAVTLRDSNTRSAGAPSGNLVTSITGSASDIVTISNQCAGGGLSFPNQMTVTWVGTSSAQTNGSQLIPQSGSYGLHVDTVTSIAISDASSVVRINATVSSGGGGGGGGGGTSGGSIAGAVPVTLSLDGSTAVCTVASPNGVAGSWLFLPKAGDCRSRDAARAKATLLGWSTYASFPAARAQEQIDRHWGVIDERIDGIRMIFIPAGGAVLASADNTLYPVWSA